MAGWRYAASGVILLVAANAAAARPMEPVEPIEEAWDVRAPRGLTRGIDFVTDQGTWMSVDVSPDGRFLVFDLLGHVYRLPSSGGEAELLTGDSGIALNFHPRYSPDGRQIAFISDRGGQNNLWVMSDDGTQPRAIFQDDAVCVVEPTWLPGSVRHRGEAPAQLSSGQLGLGRAVGVPPSPPASRGSW